MGKRFLTRRIGLLLLVTVIAVGVFAVIAGPAAAYSNFVHGTATACSNCHPNGTATPPTNSQCTACHTGGFVPLTVAGNAKATGTCWGCHTPGQPMTDVKATSAGCSSAAAGCHATGTAAPHVGATNTTCLTCHGTTVTSTNPGTSPHHVAGVTAKPVLTVAVSPSSVKVKKSIKANGLAYTGPVASKVTVTVQKQSGAKWTKVTSKVVTATSAGAWSYSYKATKKGSFRVMTTTPAATGVTAGSVTSKTFKVK
ncbi:MAG: hypothetical protein WCN81_06060 [Actinomycetes bacterium]